MAFDRKFTAAVLVLNFFGLLLIYSGTVDPYAEEAVPQFFVKQLIFSLAGLMIFYFLSTRKFTLAAWKGFVIAGFVICLIATILANFSEPVKGSSRWINLGIVNIQPSEFLKIFVIGILGFIIDSNLERVIKVGLIYGICFICFLAVFIQPDLGTATMFLLYGWVAGFLVCKPRGYLFATAAILCVAVPSVWSFVLKPYQKNRILALVQGEDPLGSNWQSTQSMIAVGSGGLFGKGFLNGTQTRMELIPERHTDFIMAILAEEFGLVGCAVVVMITLFIVLKMMLVQTSNEQIKVYSILGGIKLGFESIVNMLMVGGLFPVVGVAYPFLSYGGSSLLSNYILLGLYASFLQTSTGAIDRTYAKGEYP